ncbi:hypothetical protein BKA70DRAFT_1400281 [Coprinopsis sp. MPI-PUGE-AT-0042]|nr:hypothetical protein BKA70DRAFT_1400281 [Coprinopsis sp. MPI-PUGE-AT-0042]
MEGFHFIGGNHSIIRSSASGVTQINVSDADGVRSQTSFRPGSVQRIVYHDSTPRFPGVGRTLGESSPSPNAALATPTSPAPTSTAPVTSSTLWAGQYQGHILLPSSNLAAPSAASNPQPPTTPCSSAAAATGREGDSAGIVSSSGPPAVVIDGDALAEQQALWAQAQIESRKAKRSHWAIRN